MLHYYLMAIYLLLALAAIKIDGWVSAIVLVIAMFACSPMFQLPDKRLKWAIVVALTLLALLLFPDIEQYRHAFEESLDTTPMKQN